MIMLIEYIPLIVQLLIGFALAIIFLLLSEWLGAKRVTEEKRSTYESGMEPFRTARERFSVKFYLVAMIFIIFDIEIVFMYPWAVGFSNLELKGLIAMILFIVMLFAGYIYVVKKGALKWD